LYTERIALHVAGIYFILK